MALADRVRGPAHTGGGGRGREPGRDPGGAEAGPRDDGDRVRFKRDADVQVLGHHVRAAQPLRAVPPRGQPLLPLDPGLDLDLAGLSDLAWELADVLGLCSVGDDGQAGIRGLPQTQG